jgi:SAM-dependent methyltransferase
MHFSSLAESGLGISRSEITELFEPFAPERFDLDAQEWRSELHRRKRKLLRKYLKRNILRWSPSTQRDEATIISEYSKAWNPDAYKDYRLGSTPPRLSPWIYAGQGMLASDVGGTRFRQLMLIRIIEQVRPKRVLEVGCGNGINLMLLACRFPEIEFAGLELTQEGHATAAGMQQQAELPAAMQEYAPLPLEDPSAFRRIRFVQGSAAELPFEDNEFDLVYTILALEQMERIRDQALREIARVAGKHTLMLEPFRDVNKGWARINVIQRNYFRGAIDELPHYGLRPVMASDDFPQEVFLKACAVLSEKQGSD